MGKWSIRLLDKISVHRPDGSIQPLPTRRAAAILALLTVAKGSPVSREKLAEILWPQSDRQSRAQSLRTEISILRQALGPSSPVDINRTTCRIDPNQIETDYPPVTLEAYARLATEMPEPWFCDLRTGRTPSLDATPTSTSTREAEPEALFLRLLLWSLEDNPDATLELMRASPELTCSLVPADLHGVCSKLRMTIRRNDETFGWLRFFEGLAYSDRCDFSVAQGALREASGLAAHHEDARLFVDAVLWETVIMIVMGKAQAGSRHVEKAYSFVNSNDKKSIARMLHAQGLAYHHCGRFADGDASLLAALDMPMYQSGLIERGNLLSHIALFRATHNELAGASEALTEALRVSGPSAHWRLKGVHLLTRALILLASGEREEAEKELNLLLLHGEQVQADDLTIYAQETLARLYVQQNDHASARKLIRRSLKRRQESSMGITRWDRDRLHPVMTALEQNKTGGVSESS